MPDIYILKYILILFEKNNFYFFIILWSSNYNTNTIMNSENSPPESKNNEFDDEMEFKIVGATEANSLKGKISNESPLGKALIGAKIGDVVSVEAPAGVIEYTILDIYKPE